MTNVAIESLTLMISIQDMGESRNYNKIKNDVTDNRQHTSSL